METFRKGKGKKHAKVQDFPLSDEEENARPKKVSFLKSKKTSSPVEGHRAENGETEKTSSSIRSQLNESPQSTLSSGKSESGRSRSVLSPKPERRQPDHEQLSISPRGQSESPTDKRDQRDQEFSPQWGPSESVQSQDHSLSWNMRSDSSVSGLFNSENTQRESLSPQLFEGGQRVMSHSTENSEPDKTLSSVPQGPPLPHPRDPSVKEKPKTGQYMWSTSQCCISYSELNALSYVH